MHNQDDYYVDWDLYAHEDDLEWDDDYDADYDEYPEDDYREEPDYYPDW